MQYFRKLFWIIVSRVLLTKFLEVVPMTKDIYTIGQVAMLFRISPHTVVKLFDDKLLKGFKIPGSKHRRIPKNCLIEFMEKYQIPLNFLR